MKVKLNVHTKLTLSTAFSAVMVAMCAYKLVGAPVAQHTFDILSTTKLHIVISLITKPCYAY